MRHLIASLLLCAFQGWAAPLFAQAPRIPASIAASAAQAKTAYSQGVMAMGRLDYRQAVRSFETATQYSPAHTVYAEALRLARQKLRESLATPERSTP
jgi:hypothetical protein